MSFLNRKELEDKIGEDLSVNWPESPPTGTERDVPRRTVSAKCLKAGSAVATPV